MSLHEKRGALAYRPYDAVNKQTMYARSSVEVRLSKAKPLTDTRDSIILSRDEEQLNAPSPTSIFVVVLTKMVRFCGKFVAARAHLDERSLLVSRFIA